MVRPLYDQIGTKRTPPIWVRGTRGPGPNLIIVRRMLLLTSSIGGLQIIWSTILSNGTPFLISLGFPKSATALIWIIAPFCGAFVQPYFGMLGDQSRNILGRRRPFMLGGAIAVSVSLLCFGFSPAIVRGTLYTFGSNISEGLIRRLVMANAVLWFCVLNVAIQPLQIASRAFIVENCATNEQVRAHAWAGRVQGLSSIVGYLLASMPLPTISFYGSLPQFPILSLLSSLLLLAAVFVSCYFIYEEAPRSLPTVKMNKSSLSASINHLTMSLQQMPTPIRKICFIQCFAWMAWFPFLAYYTTYIAGVYDRESSPPSAVGQQRYGTPQPATSPGPAALRFGSFAGLLLTIVAFVSTCIIPFISSIIPSSSSSSEKHPAWHPTHQLDSTSSIPTLTLTKIWTYANLYLAITIFALTSLDLILPSSPSPLRVPMSTVLVASIGVPWAVTLWVPYCLVGVELRRSQRSAVFALQDEDEDRDQRESCLNEILEMESDQKAEAGAVMGFHNTAISAPQILSAVISALVFAATKRGGEGVGLEWAMRIGGLWAIGAAFLAWKMEKGPARVDRR